MIKVYYYKNKETGKMYIGQTSLTLEKRAGSNFIGYRECTKFYNEIKLLGLEKFERGIFAEVESREEANILEEELIAKYKTQDDKYGYNIQPGGNKFEMNESIKRNIGIAVKKSEKFKVNNFNAHAKKVVAISISDKQYTVFNSLTAASEALKLSRGNIGSICHGKGRAISLSGYLFRFLDNFTPSMIDTYIAEYIARYNSRYNDARNLKISKTIQTKRENKIINSEYLHKPVMCIDTGEKFESIKAASLRFSLRPSLISSVCNGKRKTTGGLKFTFLCSETNCRTEVSGSKHGAGEIQKI